MPRMTTPPKVSIGPTSILNWLLGGAGILTSVVLSLENSQALVAGPGKWPAILGAGILGLNGLGRQFQAAHLTKAAVVVGDVVKVGDALTPLVGEAAQEAMPAAPAPAAPPTPEPPVVEAPPLEQPPAGQTAAQVAVPQ